MIIYDLKCGKGHKFEGWFRDISAFEEQKSQRLITCPVCGSSDTEMIPSSITIVGKDVRTSGRKNTKEISPIKAMQLFHEYLDKNFADVGDRFTEVALKMHHGEEEKRNIKGTTNRYEEELLREEGVQFIKIPLPKFDS
ncbi:MAG: DUF1178 family protein [Syntrophales bacterium]|nr:DUF1178 family protein [Syntrophales bacterium]